MKRVRERIVPLPALPFSYRILQAAEWRERDGRLAGFMHGLTTGKPVPNRICSGLPVAHPKPMAIDRAPRFKARSRTL